MAMTLADFAATGRDVADLGAEIEGMDLDGLPGRVYCHDGGAYIQREGDIWYLILACDEFFGTLRELEPRLFDWARSEGMV